MSIQALDRNADVEHKLVTDLIQEQLIAARKQQILDAAAVVFADKGFHSTTIRDVAKRAGIADGTIYNYFDSKPALLMGIFERMRASILQDAVLPDPASLDVPTFVRMFLYHPLMALKQDNFGLFRIVLSEILVNDDLRQRYQSQVLQPMLAGVEPYFLAYAAQQGIGELEARLIVRAIAGMILGLTLEYTLHDDLLTDHWEHLPDVLTTFILHGLTPRTA